MFFDASFIDKIHQKSENILLPIGYSTTATLGSVPFWPEDFHGWLSVCAVAMAALVGATTVWLNICAIIKNNKNK